MTDIDAIRKRDDDITRPLFLNEPDDLLLWERRALRLAYDAKCEELAIALASCTRLGNDREKFLAERDAAVRERDGLRYAINEYRTAQTNFDYCGATRSEHYWARLDLLTLAKERLEAALDPPTEQTTEQTKVTT